MKRVLAAMAAVCLALSLQGCNRHRPLTSQEQAIVKDLTAHLTPRCVGRYLIDMPADVHIFQSIKVEGVHISTEPMTIDAHRRAIQNRSDELTTAKSYFGYRFLYADQEVKGIPDSRYFVSLGSIYEDPDSIRIIEAYRWNSGHQIKMQVAASSAKDSLYFKDQPSIRDDPDMTNVSERLSQVISLLSRARGRSDDEIPGEPGVCFQGGFLQGKARDRENTSTMFVLNGHDDVSFNIDTDSDIQTEDSLLQRGAQIRTALSRSSGRTLRNGSVALKDLPAEEWLMAGKTVLRIQGFHFSLEANSVIGSPLSPLISLDLDVGAPNKLLNLHELDRVSLTEGESIALWDKVTRTLRPRPNAF
ncbi:hypothetical protein K6V90_00015 [Cupriavidus pauculus]|nr:hypothetical protein [Cupriavidus pauculus]